jgi:hypothetical protein
MTVFAYPDASSSATFLIYGQLQHSDKSSSASKPKLELLAARRKFPPKPDTSHGHAGLRPGQPLPRGKSRLILSRNVATDHRLQMPYTPKTDSKSQQCSQAAPYDAAHQSRHKPHACPASEVNQQSTCPHPPAQAAACLARVPSRRSLNLLRSRVLWLLLLGRSLRREGVVRSGRGRCSSSWRRMRRRDDGRARLLLRVMPVMRSQLLPNSPSVQHLETVQARCKEQDRPSLSPPRSLQSTMMTSLET